MSLATASVFRDPNYTHHKIFQMIFFKNSIIFIKENPILKYVGNRLIKQVSNIQNNRGKTLHGKLLLFKIKKIHLGRKVHKCDMGLNQAGQCCQTESPTGAETPVY